MTSKIIYPPPPPKKKKKSKKERTINFQKLLWHVVGFEPTISNLAAIRYVHSANRDRDEKRIRKCIIKNPIFFVMFGNLNLEKWIHTSSWGICMSASLILFTYSLYLLVCKH